MRCDKASATRDEDPLRLVGLMIAVVIGHDDHKLQDRLRVPATRLSSSNCLKITIVARTRLAAKFSVYIGFAATHTGQMCLVARVRSVWAA